MTMTETQKMYYDLQALDLFFNTNDGSAKIAKMIKEVRAQRKLAETSEVKYLWMQLESKFNLLAQEMVDVLRAANKKALNIGYKIVEPIDDDFFK